MSYDLDYDFDNIPADTFKPLEGPYLAEVIDRDVRNTDPEKQGILVTYSLLEGVVGKKFTEYFNLKHPHRPTGKGASAEQIGRGQFKRRCGDMGFSDVPKNSAQIIGRKLLLILKAEPSDKINPGTGEPYINSVIKGSHPVGWKGPKEKVKDDRDFESLDYKTGAEPMPPTEFDPDEIPF